MKKLLLPLIVVSTAMLSVFLVFGALEQGFHVALEDLKGSPHEYAIASLVILISDIVLPVPSSIVMYFNGFVLGVPLGSALSFLSLMVSSSIGYVIGRFAGPKVRNEQGGNAATILNRYGATAIILTRGIPVLSESICIVCGYLRIPFRKYFFLSALGYLPLCFLYAAFGYLGKQDFSFLFAFSCSVLVSALIWIFGHKLFPIGEKMEHE